jgi:hypothetical protein
VVFLHSAYTVSLAVPGASSAKISSPVLSGVSSQKKTAPLSFQRPSQLSFGFQFLGSALVKVKERTIDFFIFTD